MENEHIVRVIADMACFLEFTGAPALDEDAAVSAMEQLSYELGQLSEIEKRDLARVLLEISPSYGDRAAFVCSLPDVLGIR